MEKMNISDEKAKGYACIGLECLGYTDILEIRTCFLDNNEVSYDAYIGKSVYTKNVQGKILKPLSKMDFIKLVLLGMTISGIDIQYLKPVVRDGSIKYQATVNLVEYPSMGSKSKRRR